MVLSHLFLCWRSLLSIPPLRFCYSKEGRKFEPGAWKTLKRKNFNRLCKIHPLSTWKGKPHWKSLQAKWAPLLLCALKIIQYSSPSNVTKHPGWSEWKQKGLRPYRTSLVPKQQDHSKRIGREVIFSLRVPWAPHAVKSLFYCDKLEGPFRSGCVGLHKWELSFGSFCW